MKGSLNLCFSLSLSLFSCNYVLILYVHEDYLLWQFKKGEKKKKDEIIVVMC